MGNCFAKTIAGERLYGSSVLIRYMPKDNGEHHTSSDMTTIYIV